MILVTGATGTIGSELVRLLSDAGVPVRVLVRDPSKAARMAASGAEVFQGDMLDRESLLAALEGCDHAFLLTPFVPDQLTPQLTMIEAAVATGDVHVVKSGVLGASLDSPVGVARQHGEADRRLRESGLQWTLLHPHAFMQNMLGMAASVSSEGVLYGASGEGRIAQIDTRDIAAVAAKALTEPGHVGKEYLLTGPAAFSNAEAAATLSQVLGREVRYVDLPEDDYRQSLTAWGLAESQIDDLVQLYARAFREGQGASVSNAVKEVTGREARSFEEFVRDHASAFGA